MPKNLIIYGGITLTSGLITNFLLHKVSPVPSPDSICLPKPKTRAKADNQNSNAQDEEINSPAIQIRNKQRKNTRTFALTREVKLSNDVVEAENTLLDEIKFLNSPTCDILKVEHLSLSIVDIFPEILSPMLGKSNYRSFFGGEGFLPNEAFTYVGSYVISNAVFGPYKRIDQTKKFLSAGPRKHLFFNP